MNTILRTLNATIDANQYEIVNGDYSPAEASEIVNPILQSRIDFLKIKNFSEQVRFDRTDDEALDGVEQLSEIRNSVNQLIQEAKLTGKSVTVRSTLSITLS